MAQRLRELSVLPKDLIPTTYTDGSQRPVTPALGNLMPSSASVGTIVLPQC